MRGISRISGRRLLRSIYLSFMGSVRSFSSGVHIINSHFAARVNPNYELYHDFLSYLNANCDLVRIEEATKLIIEGISTSDCLVAFTFDDGFEECYSIIAKALEEFHTNGAFFINGGYINGDNEYQENFLNNVVHTPGKNPMNWKQISKLNSRGHIIGSHTLDHVNLNHSNLDFIDDQILINKKLIEQHTGISCDYFAFPYGGFHHIRDETLKIAETYHKYIYSATDYKHYRSFNGRVINRRHIESEWPQSHINYFLSHKKKD